MRIIVDSVLTFQTSGHTRKAEAVQKAVSRLKGKVIHGENDAPVNSLHRCISSIVDAANQLLKGNPILLRFDRLGGQISAISIRGASEHTVFMLRYTKIGLSVGSADLDRHMLSILNESSPALAEKYIALRKGGASCK